MGVNIRQLENVGSGNYRLISKADGSWTAEKLGISSAFAYVDPVNGDNTSGLIGSADKPFKDPWAAVDAIESLPSSQEYTLFWLPGEYTVGDDAGNLKVTTNVAEGNLHSNTHVINHYLFRGATLQIVTDSVSTALFIPTTGSNNKIRILGEGTISHNRVGGQGLLGSFLDDSGLTDSEETDIIINLSSLELTGANWGPYLNIQRNSTLNVNIGVIDGGQDQIFLQLSPNSTAPNLNIRMKLKVGLATGQFNGLIRSIGNPAATQGVENSSIDIDITLDSAATINGPLVQFYRILIQDSIIHAEVSGTALRGSSAASLVDVTESPAVGSAVSISYNGLRTNLDTISQIDTVSTAASPHPDNNNQINIDIKGLVAFPHASQGSTPLINYNYSNAQPGTKVNIHVDATLEDRLFFTFREAQYVTISGDIKSLGSVSPLLIGEPLSDDSDYKKMLKNLFIDAENPINVNGNTGSEIYTANYTDRGSVTVTTL